MNKEALLKVAEIARNLNPATLDMEIWACGTIKCLMGHAASDPWFTERGFNLKRYDNVAYPQYLNYHSFKAVEFFFELTNEEVTYLFDSTPDNVKKTPEQLAQQIEDFVNAHN